jgi:hypothetical protein
VPPGRTINSSIVVCTLCDTVVSMRRAYQYHLCDVEQPFALDIISY